MAIKAIDENLENLKFSNSCNVLVVTDTKKKFLDKTKFSPIQRAVQVLVIFYP